MTIIAGRTEAIFATRCPVCERPIDVGDPIVLPIDAPGWLHAGCEDRWDVPVESANPVCPECFIQHAGECA